MILDNQKLARAIERGLARGMIEDATIYGAREERGSQTIALGSILAIALAGKKKVDDPEEAAQWVYSVAELAEEAMEAPNPVAELAGYLNISVELAEKIDTLHRSQRKSAQEIATMLRYNEI